MVVDAHLHYLRRDRFVDDLLRDMDDAGVTRTNLVALWEAGFMNATTGGNDEVLAAVRAHPDRLSGFAYLDPTEADCVDEVRRCADQGFAGFKLFPPIGYRVDEDRCRPMFDTISQTGLPVLVHCGQTNLDHADRPHTRAVNSALAHPMYLDPITRLYPQTTFIIAHMGFPWFMEAWSVAMANANVILDTAGGPRWPWSWVDVYDALGRPIPIDWQRVWWGTDNCITPNEGIPFARERLSQAGCTDNQVAWVLGGCARQVLGTE